MGQAPTLTLSGCFLAARPLLVAAMAMATATTAARGQAPQQSARPTHILDVACPAPPAPAAPDLPVVTPTIAWRGEAVRWGEWPVLLGPRGVRATIVVVLIDPRRTTLALDIASDGDGLGPWTIDRASSDAQVAFNAGQFTDRGPWGWVVHRGREWQAPGLGSLAAAVVVDSSARVSILAPWQVASERASGTWREALQSYPLLLDSARAPSALCIAGAIDRTHRDIRLALGVRLDGQVILALSRYTGAGAAGSRLPIGPTTLEMAEMLRRLGADRAVMLDGGLSAQLLLRDKAGTHRWAGLRAVPLALVGRKSAQLANDSARR